VRSKNTATGTTEVDARQCVFLGGIIVTQVLKHDQHAALKTVLFLLFLLTLLGKFKSIVLISELFLFLFSFLLLSLLLTELLLLLDLYIIFTVSFYETIAGLEDKWKG